MEDLSRQFVPVIIPPPSPTTPQPPKKNKFIPREELNSTLRRLFVNEFKNGSCQPPDIMQVKALLDRGADPNIRIPLNPNLNSCCEKGMGTINASTTATANSNRNKLPNILFAVILLSDDPTYAKLLVNYGCETMPQDQYFPNAFVFAAK